jgi:hypothetical protein
LLALYAAAKLGLADLLKDAPWNADDLAKLSGTHALSLYRVLRALASVGVFSQAADGLFSSTPLSSTLETDAPASLRGFVVSELGEDHYLAWAELLHSVRTGEVAFKHLFGVNVWEYRAQHPEDARIFDDAMASFTAASNDAILSGYDFSPFSTIVDVGGGDGGLIAAILKANPAAQGVVFDVPHALIHAQQRLEAAGLTNRCRAIAGDFFESVPGGGDAYLVKCIIHDWDDERAVTILTNCRRVMEQDAKLVLIEAVIPPGNVIRSCPSSTRFQDWRLLFLVQAPKQEA